MRHAATTPREDRSDLARRAGRRSGVRAAKGGEGRPVDPVADLPPIPLTPIPVTGRTGPRPGY